MTYGRADYLDILANSIPGSNLRIQLSSDEREIIVRPSFMHTRIHGERSRLSVVLQISPILRVTIRFFFQRARPLNFDLLGPTSGAPATNEHKDMFSYTQNIIGHEINLKRPAHTYQMKPEIHRDCKHPRNRFSIQLQTKDVWPGCPMNNRHFGLEYHRYAQNSPASID